MDGINKSRITSIKLKNIAVLPLSFLKWLQVVRVLRLSFNPTTSRASALSKSIPLITNPRWTVFTHSSKYYESAHFLFELSKFSGASMLIPLSCFDNFLCSVGIDIPVVDSHYSCSTDFVFCPSWLLFRDWRMLCTDEALLDPTLQELPDPLSLGSFQPAHCPCCLFISSLVFSSPESLSSSSCDEVPCLVADSVMNVNLVEVLGALLRPLHLFCGVCR